MKSEKLLKNKSIEYENMKIVILNDEVHHYGFLDLYLRYALAMLCRLCRVQRAKIFTVFELQSEILTRKHVKINMEITKRACNF